MLRLAIQRAPLLQRCLAQIFALQESCRMVTGNVTRRPAGRAGYCANPCLCKLPQNPHFPWYDWLSDMDSNHE